jgi:hypothetical protein
LSAADFDRYCDEPRIAEDDRPTAFADWLAQQTGSVILGGAVSEPPEFIAVRTSRRRGRGRAWSGATSTSRS